MDISTLNMGQLGHSTVRLGHCQRQSSPPHLQTNVLLNFGTSFTLKTAIVARRSSLHQKYYVTLRREKKNQVVLGTQSLLQDLGIRTNLETAEDPQLVRLYAGQD